VNTKPELEIISFKDPAEWRKWLDKNHATAPGIWVRFFKKASGIESINYAQALDEALCFGWIDGQVKSLDEQSYLQRFTPRRPRSNWSKRNTEHIARLIKLGKMAPAGIKAVADAKADGRWDKAYAPPSEIQPPDDFLIKLSKNKKAGEFFKTLNKTNTYAIFWNIENAKKLETRERKIQKYIEMLSKGEKLH
jgi:uncharacterized protein YdeI (YjbR/CyaY-like superfamily)